MFDVTNKDSFNKIKYWFCFDKEKYNIDSKIILIGNKIDRNDKRVISKVEAEKLASKYNINYYECCCLNGLNVYEILIEFILTICNYNENLLKIRKPFTLKGNSDKKIKLLKYIN